MPEDLPEDVGFPEEAQLHGVNLSGIVYGVLAVATVIAAEGTRHETFLKLFLASVLSMTIYWVGHAYSHSWGLRFEKAGGWSVREIGVSLLFESSILIGALVPTAALLVAWIAGSSLETAVTAVLWTAGVEIVVLEVAPAIRGHLEPKDLLVETVAGISLGVGILGLRLLLH